MPSIKRVEDGSQNEYREKVGDTLPGVAAKFVRIQPNARILRELATLVDTGIVRPLVGTEFSLKDIPKAHELSESGRSQGKIVIHVGLP